MTKLGESGCGIRSDGVAGVSGWAGEFLWAGYAGGLFLGRSRKEVVAVYMAQAPSSIRAYYRKMFKSLVYQALVKTAYYVGALAAQ